MSRKISDLLSHCKCAIWNGKLEQVQFLLEQGVPYNQHSQRAGERIWGDSFFDIVKQDITLPLAAADSIGPIPHQADTPPCPLAAMKWLLEHGADPHMKDKEGHTALDLASDEQKKTLLRSAMNKSKP